MLSIERNCLNGLFNDIEMFFKIILFCLKLKFDCLLLKFVV